MKSCKFFNAGASGREHGWLGVLAYRVCTHKNRIMFEARDTNCKGRSAFIVLDAEQWEKLKSVGDELLGLNKSEKAEQPPKWECS